MKTPLYWQSKNLSSRLLYPLGCLYAGATWLRTKLNTPEKVSVPVICIGNLTAGGSGKTPTAISIASLLQQAGKNPFFISRGYGGQLQDVLVDLQKHTPQEVGDEPLLLSRQAPVVVNAKRNQAAKKAIENGADIIIMDDGFQNPSLYKDKSLLVIDGQAGLGNMYPIPAGPMREFFRAGLERAHGIIMLGNDRHHILSKIKNKPVFQGHIIPKKPELSHPSAIAFAGIGRPQKFYQSLEDCNISLIKTVDFPDHHFYREGELTSLIKQASELNADLLTTSKDFVKIPFKLRPAFKVLEISIEWQNERALEDFLLKVD